ncbi:MAG: N-acetylglucosamine-6-phosphate deacetylase [Clostridia bacterium]
MLIKNVQILNQQFEFATTDIQFQQTIETIGSGLTAEAETIDGTGMLLIPGLIDVHTHGAVGHDGCDGNKESYEKLAKYYAANGVTSFLLTTMALAEKQLTSVLAAMGEFILDQQGEGAYASGIYLEGPFLQPFKKGAQNAEFLVNPDLAMLERLNIASKTQLKIVAVAPELKGAMDFIQQSAKKMRVSLAHTSADYQVAAEAFARGASSVTHLFNGMDPFLHRAPGVVGAALDHEEVFVELICDGNHLHPATVRSVFKQCGRERVVLISDSNRATGMPAGSYELGGQEVQVNQGKCTLANGTLAGSVINLLDAVKNCIALGIPAEIAVQAASINPANLIGTRNFNGSIACGKNADLLLLDQDWNLLKTFVQGKICY